MKRNIVIATVAAAALIAGGTATSLAVTGKDTGAPTHRSSGQPGADDGPRHDAGDDRGDARDDDRDDDGKDDRHDKVVEGSTLSGRTAVTAQDAIARALGHTPGTAVGAELDDENGSVLWEVEVIDGDGAWHDVRVSPAGGTVLGSRTEHEDDTARVRAALNGTSVSAAEAARAVASKGKVTEIDVDEDSRTPVWKVETLTSKGVEREWRVDLDTGRVTADRDHRSDDHADDDSDDDRARPTHAADDRTERKRGADDGAAHSRGADDDAGHARGSDDAAGHPAGHGNGHGSDDGPGHDAGDDSGHRSGHGSGHGSDDD